MKKCLIYLMTGLMAILALSSCSGDDGVGQGNIFIHYDSDQIVDCAGDSFEIPVEAPGEWQAFASVEWITINTKSGTGNAVMSFTVDTNYSSRREGHITVSNGTDAATVKVIQATAIAGAITCNKDFLLFEGVDDGIQRIELEIETGAGDWTATHEEWIHIGKSGNTAIVTVDPYYQYVRSGKITFFTEESGPRAEVAVHQANFIKTHFANAYYLGNIENNGFGRLIIEIDQDMYQVPNYLPKILSMDLAMEPLAFDQVELVPGIYTLTDNLEKGYLLKGGTFESGGITYISGTHEGDLTFFGYTRITVLDDGFVVIERNDQTGDYTIKSFLKGTALNVDDNLAPIGEAYGCYSWQGPVNLHNYIPREETVTISDALALYQWEVGGGVYSWNVFLGLNGAKVNYAGYDLVVTGESGGALIMNLFTGGSGDQNSIPDGTYYSDSSYGVPFAISSAQYMPVDASEDVISATVRSLKITNGGGNVYNVECDVVLSNNLTFKGQGNITFRFDPTEAPSGFPGRTAVSGNTTAVVKPWLFKTRTYGNAK